MLGEQHRVTFRGVKIGNLLRKGLVEQHEPRPMADLGNGEVGAAGVAVGRDVADPLSRHCFPLLVDTPVSRLLAPHWPRYEWPAKSNSGTAR